MLPTVSKLQGGGGSLWKGAVLFISGITLEDQNGNISPCLQQLSLSLTKRKYDLYDAKEPTRVRQPDAARLDVAAPNGRLADDAHYVLAVIYSLQYFGSMVHSVSYVLERMGNQLLLRIVTREWHKNERLLVFRIQQHVVRIEI